MNTYFSPCPVETTLNLIGNKWKIIIIRDLLENKKRFGELKKMHRTKQKSKYITKSFNSKFKRAWKSKTY